MSYMIWFFGPLIGIGFVFCVGAFIGRKNMLTELDISWSDFDRIKKHVNDGRHNHYFELFADGYYHCSDTHCSVVIKPSDYRLGMGSTVDGIKCGNCGSRWYCDQQKTCACRLPVMIRE